MSQFALAEARRTHIITMLLDSSSGVSSEVTKQGSPYKLRLQKPKNLHISETKQRAQWQTALADLQLVCNRLFENDLMRKYS